jgi:hypothetical protein
MGLPQALIAAKADMEARLHEENKAVLAKALHELSTSLEKHVHVS